AAPEADGICGAAADILGFSPRGPARNDKRRRSIRRAARSCQLERNGAVYGDARRLARILATRAVPGLRRADRRRLLRGLPGRARGQPRRSLAATVARARAFELRAAARPLRARAEVSRRAPARPRARLA